MSRVCTTPERIYRIKRYLLPAAEISCIFRKRPQNIFHWQESDILLHFQHSNRDVREMSRRFQSTAQLLEVLTLGVEDYCGSFLDSKIDAPLIHKTA